MTQSKQAVSPLRQRMIDDLRMRKLSPKTQTHYLRIVRQFAGYLGRSPDTATVEELRRYQLHLVDQGTSPISLNAAITGLKFFFDVTLDHAELMAKMQPVRVPQKLPVVLSRDEVARLIVATGNLKHQTVLSVAYGTGLRASEVVALKVGDIDSERMTLRVEQGKGRRDRYAMLSPVLLARLRTLVAGCPRPRQDARWRLVVSRPRIPSTRSALVSSTAPCMPRRRRHRSTSALLCTRFGTVLRLTCSSRRWTSA
jgi:integrase/recombinase XerD